jgi:hypothetical protein
MGNQAILILPENAGDKKKNADPALQRVIPDFRRRVGGGGASGTLAVALAEVY